MSEIIDALKAEIAEFINSAEPRLMSSPMAIHQHQHQSETMAVMYRHRPDELPTVEYRSCVVELYWSGDKIIVAVHKGILTDKPEPHRGRRSAEIHIPPFSIETGRTPTPIHLVTKRELIESTEFFPYQDNPQKVPEWVLRKCADWLIVRLPFKSA